MERSYLSPQVAGLTCAYVDPVSFKSFVEKAASKDYKNLNIRQLNKSSLKHKMILNLIENFKRKGIAEDRDVCRAKDLRLKAADAIRKLSTEKYVRRININRTFNRFSKVISDDEINRFKDQIWRDAHNDQFNS